MSSNPFQIAIDKAKTDKKAKDEAVAAEVAARKAEAEARREAAAAKARDEKLTSFPNDFRNRVVKYVFSNRAYDANPGFTELTANYADALLSTADVELPKLASSWAQRVHAQFEFALEFAGDAIPEGHFYGQRLLAQRGLEAQPAAKPDRVRITTPTIDMGYLDEIESPVVPMDEPTGTVVDIDSKRGTAVTPRTKGKDKRPQAARTQKSDQTASAG